MSIDPSESSDSLVSQVVVSVDEVLLEKVRDILHAAQKAGDIFGNLYSAANGGFF